MRPWGGELFSLGLGISTSTVISWRKPRCSSMLAAATFAGGNGPDGSGRAGNAVAAGEHAVHIPHLPRQARHKGTPLDGDTGLIEALDLDALSDGHHDDIRRDADLLQRRLAGTGTPCLVHLPDDLGLDPQGLGGAVLIGLDADGSGQRHQLGSLRQRTGDLVRQRRHVPPDGGDRRR